MYSSNVSGSGHIGGGSNITVGGIGSTLSRQGIGLVTSPNGVLYIALAAVGFLIVYTLGKK